MAEIFDILKMPLLTWSSAVVCLFDFKGVVFCSFTLFTLLLALEIEEFMYVCMYVCMRLREFASGSSFEFMQYRIKVSQDFTRNKILRHNSMS